MEISVASSPGAPKAIGPYSQALVAGNLVFCSGQIPVDPESGTLVAGEIDVQTDRVLENLAAVLSAAGSDLSRVVKTTVYLRDLKGFAAMNRAYEKHFGHHRPARATVEVTGLPADAGIEVDCIAVLS